MTSPLNSVATENGRYYEWAGDRYLSVTNVLSKSIAKDALLPWGVKLTAEKALAAYNFLLRNGREPAKQKLERKVKGQAVMKEVDHDVYWKAQHRLVKEASAERGSIIHDWAEQWTLAGNVDSESVEFPEMPPLYEDECRGIMRAFDHYQIKAEVAECTVYSRAHKYAGSADLIATVGAYGGARFLLDFKTGKNAWPETAYQLAAYRFGEFIGLPDGTEEPVPETQGGGVLHVDFGQTSLIPYKCGRDQFEVFTHMVAVAYDLVENSKTLMNPPSILSA